jgi:urea carboxylase-associated protein 2
MAISGLSVTDIVQSEKLRGGQMWSRVIRRGNALRIIDLEGGASVAGLFYNDRDRLERYNMADTLKAQHTGRITKGYVLYSDMGRILLSVIEDTCGWHDTITGCMNRRQSVSRYGRGGYQELRNDFVRNTRDNFLVELGKHGLSRRDIVANLNFFVKVAAKDNGDLGWIAGNSKAGAHIDLRAEMDVLIVLSNTPHPLDPSPNYAPKPVELVIWKAPPVGEDDLCRRKRPENERGFALTRAYFE